MIIGNPETIAIESSITTAFERPGFLALGYFVIHVCGRRYGLQKPDATLLACSFDEVKRRVDASGSHVAAFADDPEPGVIADAFRSAVYGAIPNDMLSEVAQLQVSQLVRNSNGFVWAPDGDCAFDDGSFVLQFDVGNRVRIIAFRCKEDGLHDPATLSDLWIESEEFYSLLAKWHHDFYAEWLNFPKVVE